MIWFGLLSGQGHEGGQMTRWELPPTDKIRRDLEVRVLSVELLQTRFACLLELDLPLRTRGKKNPQY